MQRITCRALVRRLFVLARQPRQASADCSHTAVLASKRGRSSGDEHLGSQLHIAAPAASLLYRKDFRRELVAFHGQLVAAGQLIGERCFGSAPGL